MINTWFGVLKLLLLVMVHHDVRLHGDQLLLVELAQVQQGELVKLLVAEEHLIGHKGRGCQFNAFINYTSNERIKNWLNEQSLAITKYE